jgi:hypothetical protein
MSVVCADCLATNGFLQTPVSYVRFALLTAGAHKGICHRVVWCVSNERGACFFRLFCSEDGAMKFLCDVTK